MSAKTACPVWPAPTAPTPQSVWCEAVCFDGTGSSWVLDCYFAPCGLAAIRWMRDRAVAMADQLDPEPAKALRAWVRDATRAEVHLAACVDQGETYRVSTTETGALYTLSLTPHEAAPSHPDGSHTS